MYRAGESKYVNISDNFLFASNKIFLAFRLSTWFLTVAINCLLLTVRWAESSGCSDHGQRGAAMHRAQVMLHVRVDVRVRWTEGGVTGRHGGRRQVDQGDVGDNGAAGQTCGAGGREEEEKICQESKGVTTIRESRSK